MNTKLKSVLDVLMDIPLDQAQKVLIADAVRDVQKELDVKDFLYTSTIKSRNALNSLLAQVSEDFSSKVDELEKKSAELENALEQVRALQKTADSASQIKQDFLANMSHEIRTPLTSVLGFAEILAVEVKDPENQELARLIGKSGKRLMNTLNSVLEFIRLDENHESLVLHALDACSMIRETAEVFIPQARKSGIDLNIDSPDVPVYIQADPIALSRVLNNLVQNAFQFTTEGRITISIWHESPFGVIAVEDTGIGIDDAFLPYIFESFRQESTGLARLYEGNGLGLSITQGLVHAMNGMISIKSTKGKGSTFFVRLLLAPQSQTNVQSNALPITTHNTSRAPISAH